MRTLALLLPVCLSAVIPLNAKSPDGKSKLVLIAGKPSHGPRMHEFNAGSDLLAKCLAQGMPDLHVEVVHNGWPTDESVFEGADAMVFYMDGGPGHEIVKGDGSRKLKIDALARKGVGIGCMHYGVEVEAEKAGAEFKRWIGGFYENAFSCNPMWEPNFLKFPVHPITRGVTPFQIKDEWYMNIRFASEFDAEKERTTDGTKFTPILVAPPSDAVRNGPYVYPEGPYPHIVANSGRSEAMMWAIERPDGGRGFGFTGGHYHDNWGNESFRKTVLNALVWLAKMEVPKEGVASALTSADLDANLDPKGPKK